MRWQAMKSAAMKNGCEDETDAAMQMGDHHDDSEPRVTMQRRPHAGSNRAQAVSWAAASVICSVSCILSAAGCVVLLMVQPTMWILALLLVPVLFVIAARKCDRAKMRILFGEPLGDVLHASDSASGARELAHRDHRTYQTLPEPRSIETAAVVEDSKVLSL
jgi:hypothetical protein